MPEKRENPQFILSKTKICNLNYRHLSNVLSSRSCTHEPEKEETFFFRCHFPDTYANKVAIRLRLAVVLLLDWVVSPFTKRKNMSYFFT